MATKKPSATQLRLLKMLADGWQIGSSTTMEGCAWIQQGGACKGGCSEKVHLSTFHAMITSGWVSAAKREFPTTKYDITDNGRAVISV